VSRYWKYGFIEDLDTVRHIPLGKFWGITISITPIAWLSPLVFFGLHAALRVLGPAQSAAELVRGGFVFVVGVEVSTLVHALGHILGGQLVHAPMDELLLTTTRGTNLYRGDQAALPGQVHLSRALGGPLLNLVLAGAITAAGGWLRPGLTTGLASEMLNSLVATSLTFGLGGLLLPLPSLDGQVIWRVILRSRLLQGTSRPIT